ncbi:MAG: carbohydrate kinase family protein [Chloroflexi bacterium]|nr:carbohydrate kinase family protein [Chloroflexota bacterium]
MEIAEKRIVVIGGANLDIRGRPQGQYVHMTSNPGRIGRWPGGAARNIAENLARLGCKVWLLSAVGGDESGRFIMEATSAAGVDTSLVLIAEGRPTGTYLAIFDEYGHLISAINDMQVLEEATPDYISQNIARIKNPDLLVVDANLLLETIEKVVEIGVEQGIPLAAAAVSVAKAPRLVPHLQSIDYLFCDKSQAETLLADRKISRQEEAIQAAKDLVAKGVGAAVITRGGRGLAYATAKEAGSLPALPAHVVDASGAGDALATATLFGIMSGWPTADSLQLGLAAAALTVQTENTVSQELSHERLQQMLAKP